MLRIKKTDPDSKPFQLRKRKMPGVLTTFHDGMVSLILLSAYYVRLSKEAISVMF
ncbi:hypothetical protein SEEACDC4_16588 [Salmonella enterica subsp. enterica serovar Agona str. SA-4]|nr:hypothetical protein SEEACDC4_16588 [Salmonella enterica subsp. enterica serovar Agona str. SA-4]